MTSDNWVFVTGEEQAGAWYYHTEGIERYPDFNRVWIKQVYEEPSKHGVLSLKQQIDFHHSIRKYRFYYNESYDSQGKLINSYLLSEIGEYKWEPIPPEPDSIGAKLWGVCSSL